MYNNSYFLRTSFVAAKIILFVLFLVGCGSNKLKVDVSDIELNLELKRFEQDIFSITPANSTEKIPFLKKKYGEFFKLFNERIINVGPADDLVYISNISSFINDPDIKQVYNDSQKELGDFTLYKSDLTEAFKHYKHYFPSKPIPEVVTFISGFNYAVIAADSVLAIGVDMYLGANYKYYSMLPQLAKYQVQKMRKEFIVPDAIKAWVTTEFQNDSIKTKLLDQIIQEGKNLYLMDALLPETEDSLKVGYSSSQIEWVNENEKRIWAFFIDKKLLYSTNVVENNKYVTEGPFTPGMPKESAPKAGSWIGWQIVRAYMKNNENVSLQSLLKERDAQKILNRSKYKPVK